MKDEMTGRALKGSAASKAKRDRRLALLIDLPALDSVDSVREWLHRAGQAVANGDLEYRQAQAILKAAEIATRLLNTASAEEIAALRDELRQASKIRRIK